MKWPRVYIVTVGGRLSEIKRDLGTLACQKSETMLGHGWKISNVYVSGFCGHDEKGIEIDWGRSVLLLRGAVSFTSTIPYHTIPV